MTEYYDDQDNIEEYIKLAKDVSGEAAIELLRNHLPDGAKVLELGSGPGTDWQLLSQYYNTTGSDLSDAFLQHLRNAHPQGTFLQLNASTIETDTIFDGIYSFKVLHHLNDESLKDSIARQAQVLSSNGVACHTFWNGEGDEIFKGMYVNYHNIDELKTLFAPFFEILDIRLYKEFDEDDSVLVIARKT